MLLRTSKDTDNELCSHLGTAESLWQFGAVESADIISLTDDLWRDICEYSSARSMHDVQVHGLVWTSEGG